MSLTDIKLKAFLDVGVAASSGLVVLLQHQDLLPGLGQRGGGRQPADAAPDDDDVQVLGHFVEAETWRRKNTLNSQVYLKQVLKSRPFGKQCCVTALHNSLKV